MAKGFINRPPLNCPLVDTPCKELQPKEKRGKTYKKKKVNAFAGIIKYYVVAVKLLFLYHRS